MRIIICDDDNTIPQTLIPSIKKTFVPLYTGLEIFYFESGNSLINWCKKNNYDMDVLIIDVEMPEIDGLETVSLIRKVNKECIILFISVYREFVFKAMDYEIFQYLVKPVSIEIFEIKLNLIIKKYQEKHFLHTIYCQGSHISLKIDNIYYIESSGRNAKYYTSNGIYIVSGKMSEIEKILFPYNFLRTHKSFLINMSKVIRYKSYTFFLVGGGEADISYRNRSIIIRKYEEYLKKRVASI